MAKKNNNGKPGFFSSVAGFYRKVVDFVMNPRVQFVTGLLLLTFVVFLFSSFLSYFSSGGNDFSVVEAVNAGDNIAGEVAENTSGKGGAVIAHYLINGCFGWASVLMLPLLVFLSVRLMHLRGVNLKRWSIIFVFLMLWLSLLFSFVFGERFGDSFISPGGAHGEWLQALLWDTLGVVGVILVLAVSFVLFMIYVTAETIPWLQKVFSFGMARVEDIMPSNPFNKPSRDGETVVECASTGDEVLEVEMPAVETEVAATVEDEKPDSEVTVEIDIDGNGFEDELLNDTATEIVVDDNSGIAGEGVLDDDELARKFDDMANASGAAGGALELEVEEVSVEEDTGGDMLRPLNPRDELSFYKPPTLDLLDEYEQSVHSIDKEEQAANANKIVKVLNDFNIEISSIKATVGPTITLYEITPAPGVRISKIRNLEDDIAMSLSALCIRIVAPIPGKGTIGIEVPNLHKQIVPMASLLNSRKYKETDMALPLALGKTISNEVYMVDMAKMPHLLVAGATGMGKSVGLNAIITSLLYKMHPAYLKFVMVDPKMVELSLYGVLEKHFLAKLDGDDDPIITDVNKVVRTLKSLCVEMDNRYRLLQMASVRSVKEYNEKFLNKELLPTKGHRFMPYIVVVIDEYGDLMMTAGREVEQPIARIAQKARAVGMHMIIATQRPTTNIITGTIKANFPARMAFRVISVIDSRTILDRSGANQLQGRGDMLFLAGNDPVRVQCALVETKEVERVCAYIAKQQGYQTAYMLPEPDEASEMSGDMGGSVRGEISSDRLDPLFVDAARAVVIARHGSTSLIQRKFNVGFNRAGRIMDQLCQMGIVGEQDGSKPRQVLCADEADLEFRLKSIL